jgi:uncharacterized protein (TIGR02118 family)
MHKVVVLYNTPTDPEHFKSYYETSHLPLAATMPGMTASRHSFAIEGAGGPAPYFAIWEGEWPDAAAAGAALQSEIGQKVAADTANYATGGVTIMHFTAIED